MALRTRSTASKSTSLAIKACGDVALERTMCSAVRRRMLEKGTTWSPAARNDAIGGSAGTVVGAGGADAVVGGAVAVIAAGGAAGTAGAGGPAGAPLGVAADATDRRASMTFNTSSRVMR